MVAETLRALTSNWSKNHRRFGPAAALRCLVGTRRVRSGRCAHETPAGTTDVLTFSVSPGLTLAWAACLDRALGGADETLRRTILGDASGGLAGRRPSSLDRSVEIVPIVNFHHGEKLDLFLAEVCTSDRVLISDDDVFWLDREPWRWAHRVLDDNPRVAVASLLPRTRVSSLLSDKISAPMGSSCLLVRRSRWLELGLSFRIVEPPEGKGHDWFYDTGDHAHLEILGHGDEVAIAAPEVRSSLATVDAISTWILKIQKHPPRRLAELAEHPIRGQKALRAVLLAKGLNRLGRLGRLGKLGSLGANRRRWPDLIEPGRLRAVEETIRGRLEPQVQRQLEREVDALLGKLAHRLGDSDSERSRED